MWGFRPPHPPPGRERNRLPGAPLTDKTVKEIWTVLREDLPKISSHQRFPARLFFRYPELRLSTPVPFGVGR
jgi:hypothetical protein